MMEASESIAIFGGTGFIGTHIAQHFLHHKLARKIVLLDLRPPRNESYAGVLQEGLTSGQVEFIRWDVREPIPSDMLSSHPDLIFNLAAIHREPGHATREFFETNLLGAENVCDYSSGVGCNRIVFTSSISPYGPADEMKDERSLAVPDTAYGSSKLTAEKMHIGWQSANPRRKLLILRPGVVFGPGEVGNVTRLIRSVVDGYFVYAGNRLTRKAGGYVKELGYVVQFGIEHQDRTGEAFSLFNFSSDPPPTLEEYVDVIRGIAGLRRSPLSVPRSLLLGLSYPVDILARLLGINQPISPVRVKKLFRSTSIDPAKLRALGYKWVFSTEEAFQDWKRESPKDFLKSW